MPDGQAALPELLEDVGEDSDLRPEEKETSVRFSKRDDEAVVYTAEAGLARRLLAHPHAPIDGLTVADGDAREDVPPEEYHGEGEIVGVRARVPVGALSVRSGVRSSSGHAAIVTHRVLEEVNG